MKSVNSFWDNVDLPQTNLGKSVVEVGELLERKIFKVLSKGLDQTIICGSDHPSVFGIFISDHDYLICASIGEVFAVHIWKLFHQQLRKFARVLNSFVCLNHIKRFECLSQSYVLVGLLYNFLNFTLSLLIVEYLVWIVTQCTQEYKGIVMSWSSTLLQCTFKNCFPNLVYNIIA